MRGCGLRQLGGGRWRQFGGHAVVSVHTQANVCVVRRSPCLCPPPLGFPAALTTHHSNQNKHRLFRTSGSPPAACSSPTLRWYQRSVPAASPSPLQQSPRQPATAPRRQRSAQCSAGWAEASAASSSVWQARKRRRAAPGGVGRPSRCCHVCEQRLGSAEHILLPIPQSPQATQALYLLCASPHPSPRTYVARGDGSQPQLQQEGGAAALPRHAVHLLQCYTGGRAGSRADKRCGRRGGGKLGTSDHSGHNPHNR